MTNEELQEQLDRLQQAFINFVNHAGAPDQYRQALADLGITPPEREPQPGDGFQRQVGR